MRTLSRLGCATLFLGVAGCAGSGPNCTAEPQSAWMTETAIQARIAELGYKVKTFKISGNCYEIYGWNKDGQKVEVYFNPVNGAIVKSKLE